MHNKSKLTWFALMALMVTFHTSYGQTPDGFIFSGAQPPAVIPQSPEAGSLGRYGSIPITSSTGQMSYSVPFYTIEVDGQSWPIGLNYNYGGLLLEGKPSLAGLGWNLNAEAAVTRETRGLPDEHNLGYNSEFIASGGLPTVRTLINNYAALENDGDFNTKGFDAWDIAILRNFRDGIYDGEADKYTVSAGGLYFSFKATARFDANGALTHFEPYLLSKHANKVEVLKSENRYASLNSDNYYISGFIITDTNGVKYRFDQIETSVPQGVDEEMKLNPITAWKLSEITYLNNQKIRFEYVDDAMTDYNFRVSGSGILTNIEGQSSNPNGYQPGPYTLGSEVLIYPQYGDAVSEGLINRKLISKITFPKGHIDFEYKFNANSRELFKSIKLYNKKDLINPVNWFEFSHSGNRDLLDKIEFNGEDYYEFEYHDELAIPNFIQSVQDRTLARQQDYWKFYNGAGNPWALNIPNSPFEGANRNPSLLHSRLGALKRIIYPTRGSTNIYYQQNQIATALDLNADYYRSLESGKLFELSLNAQTEQVSEKSESLEILYPTVAYINHTVSGDRSAGGISITMSRVGGLSNYTIRHLGSSIPPYPGGNDSYYLVAPYLKSEILQRDFPFAFPPMYPQLVEEFGYADIGGNGNDGIDTVTRNSGDKILIMPGVYEFKIFTQTPGAPVSASLNIQFFGKLNEPPPTRVNKKIGGIRVDYMKDCPDNSGPNCFITNYDYNDDEDFSTGVQFAIPLLQTSYTLDQINLPGENIDGSQLFRTKLITYTESPFTVSNPRMGTPVFYRKVKTIKRRNGSVRAPGVTEIGYTETEYSMPFENLNYAYPPIPTGVDLDKSMPLKTIAYEQDIEEPVSSTTNEYTSIRKLINLNTQQDLDDNHPWSINVFINKYRYVDYDIVDFTDQPNFPIGSLQDIELKKLHGAKLYRELDIWDRPKSVEKTVDGITTKQNYGYNENYQVNSLKTIDSRGNESENVTKYANDLSELNNSILNDMVLKNQLSQPVQVESFYNGALQSTQKTDFTLNANGYKPFKIFAAKGDSPLEAKMKFIYNAAGKLLQVDQLLDSPNRPGEGNEKVLKSTSYFWGYNFEYPVVKAENASYGQLTSSGADLGQLQSDANTVAEKETQLEILRNALPNAFVTGYSYKTLVGISNMTDPRGYTTRYQYDYRNRLLNVKDDRDKMVQEYEYEYRSENYTNPDVFEQYADLVGNIDGNSAPDLGVATTYTANPGGGSGDFAYAWYKDGIFITSGTNQIDIVFDDIGISNLRVDVTDNITGLSIPLTLDVTVPIDLGVVNLTSDEIFGLVNAQQFTFNATGVITTYGTLSYQWTIDNGTPESFTGETGFQTTFATPGQHTVKLRVTDSETNSFIEGETTVTIYNPLNVPNITPTVAHIEKGDNQYFNTSGVSGGSGNWIYSWFVRFGSGNYTKIPSEDLTYYNHTGFTTSGVYTIKFRVTDTNIPNHFEEITSQVNVYEPIQITNDDISTPSPVLVNTATYFNINTASGGSGNFEYEWDIINQSVTPDYGEGVGTFSEANRNVASYTVGYELVGASVKVQCRIHDLLTGEYKTVFKIISIQDNDPISGLSLGARDNDPDPESASYTISANNVQGGSGSYLYRWVINGSIVQEGPSNRYSSVELSCSKQSETITCVAIDAANTDQTIIRSITVNLGFNCGG
ncbi:PKD domain-containing protein [Maribacter sp. 2308TA10-17]|uniref:PKD domain-containing protein n=1 Tax=Maribacter sp. 2308TA10-17 TaxID=3386276 RepID=UPI0039BD394C